MTELAPPPQRVGRPRAGADVLGAIAAGGTLGATARYALARVLPPASGHVPWATLAANVSGSFVLGFLLVVIAERFPPTRLLRPFLATGVIGAYTTMSTFLVDTTVLVQHGHLLTATAYAGVTLGAGLILAYLGVVSGRSLARQRGRTDQHREAR